MIEGSAVGVLTDRPIDEELPRFMLSLSLSNESRNLPNRWRLRLRSSRYSVSSMSVWISAVIVMQCLMTICSQGRWPKYNNLLCYGMFMGNVTLRCVASWNTLKISSNNRKKDNGRQLEFLFKSYTEINWIRFKRGSHYKQMSIIGSEYPLRETRNWYSITVKTIPSISHFVKFVWVNATYSGKI